MKKKTLVILLIIPFIIALLTFVSVVALTNNVAIDIEGLRILNYRRQEGFKINGEYKLDAEISYSSNQNALLKPGANELVWSLTEKSENFDDDVAKIISKDDGYYLLTGGEEGNCSLVCSNSIGTKSDKIKIYVYDRGVILINTEIPGSGSQIDPTKYYGEYDFTYDNKGVPTKTNARIGLDVEVITDNGSTGYTFETSSNVSFDRNTSKVTINSEGDAFVKFVAQGANYLENTFSFNVVNDGVNVYSFGDLMNCTNKSENGETVVMQVNLQSLENTLNKNSTGDYIEEYKSENTKLFGNYDFRTKSFNFEDFIYYQDPKLETKFIDQFIDQVDDDYDYQTQIKIGVRVQKDFYGNGFTINMHELAYPVHGSYDNVTGVFSPNRAEDYFFGPLTFVSIGDLEQLPIIRSYLCDNAGFALDGNNLTLNDVKLQNSNNVENMYNFRFTGTVLEVQGINNTVKNSVIQNGRTCIRAFSSDGLTIDNCLLQNAGEFIVKLGSNKVNPTNHEKTVNVRHNGQTITKSFNEFFNGDVSDSTSANGVLSSFMTQSYSGSSLDTVMTTINDVQEGLDNLNGIVNSDDTKNFDSHVTINDTYFYNSGVYSIAFENSFNGAYIYNGMPSQLQEVFNLLSGNGYKVVTPNDIGGTSYPVELTLSGDTRFYDWKNIDDIDIGALIEENIKALINNLVSNMGAEIPEEVANMLASLTIDDYFPIKTLIKNLAISKNLTYQETDSESGEVKYYINRPVAWYGGGYNGSDVAIDIGESEFNDFGDRLIIDFGREVFSRAIGGLDMEDLEGTFKTVINLLSRCVVMAIGSHPFQFLSNGKIENNQKPNTFDVVPSYLDLSSRIAG